MKCLKYTSMVAALIAATALASTPVSATGSHPSTQPASTSPPSQALSFSGAASKASARSQSLSTSKSQSASASSAKQRQAQKQAQRQTAAGGVANATGGTAQTGPVTTSSLSEGSIVSVGGDHVEAPDLPVNTAIVTLANTTAECHYHNGAAGQGGALGLSLSLGRKDGDCERFMLAEFLYARGNDEAGDRIFCAIKSVKKAMGADCLVLVHQTRIVQLPVDTRLIKKQEFERISK